MLNNRAFIKDPLLDACKAGYERAVERADFFFNLTLISGISECMSVRVSFHLFHHKVVWMSGAEQAASDSIPEDEQIILL